MKTVPSYPLCLDSLGFFVCRAYERRKARQQGFVNLDFYPQIRYAMGWGESCICPTGQKQNGGESHGENRKFYH